MSAISSSTARQTDVRPTLLTAACTAVAVAMIFGALYAFASGSEETPLRAFLVITGLSVASAGVLFRFGLPRWNSRAAVVLAVIGLLGTVAYWAGIPAVLAVGGIALAARIAAREGAWNNATRAAAGIGGIALVAQLVASVLG